MTSVNEVTLATKINLENKTVQARNSSVTHASSPQTKVLRTVVTIP